MDPVGILLAGYKSGPSNTGLTVPIGSCLPYRSDPPIFLTASHILSHAPKELSDVKTEIKPKFVNFLVGIHCDSSWEMFLVNDTQEILPEVTALYLQPISVDKVNFPKKLDFEISKEELKPMFPVHIVGYPASVQSVGFQPDSDYMEILSQEPSAYHNVVSGTVSAYYKEHGPSYIPNELLPAFTIDNGVIPGMSGGSVMLNLPNKRPIVGVVIKNLKITENDYHIIHTLAISLHDIEL